MRKGNISETYPCVMYARVSTASEGQKDSCANQIELCEGYVSKNPELKVVGRYVDDAMSGGNDNRPEYQRMIARIQEGDIRYIIAKSTSRLCRSTEIDGQLQRLCREYDVQIIFAGDGHVFNPFDGDEVIMHSIQSIFDQQYIHNQSRYGRIAHKQKCDRKALDASDVRFGYVWDYNNKCMAVNEEEAAIVKRIYEWYVFGGLSVSDIGRKLEELGVYGKRSGRRLGVNIISSWLEDAAYKGTFHINKYGSQLNLGVGAKRKRLKNPKEEWVAVPGPAIIPEELFDLAQRIRGEKKHVYDSDGKTDTQARFKGTHLFAGKVFCGSCGTQFHFQFADRAETIGEYKDYFSRKKTLGGAGECSNREHNRIREDTLAAICQYSINVFLKSHEECIDNMVKAIREMAKENANDSTQLKAFQKKLKRIEKEMQKNLEAWRDVPDPDMKDAYLKMYQDNKAEKAAAEEAIMALEQKKSSIADLEEEIRRIKEKVEDMKQIREVDREVVENFIDRIIVGSDGKVAVILKFATAFEAMPKVCVGMEAVPAYMKGVEVLNFKNITAADMRELVRLNPFLSVRCSDKPEIPPGGQYRKALPAADRYSEREDRRHGG